MAYPATKNRFARRLAVAQLGGTAGGLFLIALLSPDPAPLTASWWDQFELLFLGGMTIGLAAYVMALLALHAFISSILRRSLICCIAVPGGLLALSLLLPSPAETIHWLTGIALCAAVAGLIFVASQRLRPMTLPMD